MNAWDYVQLCPVLWARIERSKSKIEGITPIGSPDCTQPGIAGGRPGDPTSTRAIKLAEERDKIKENLERLATIIALVEAPLKTLPADQRAAVICKHIMAPGGNLPDRIKKTYKRDVSVRKYYSDLKKAKEVLITVEM